MAARDTPITVGETLPNVIFKARVRDESIGGPNPFTWKDVSVNDLFKGKRAVLFALPGEEIRSLGIDEVYVLSVNDAFVMRQWGIHLGLEEENKDASNPLNPGNFRKVKFIPDGAALFTRAVGFSTFWTTERGFGERSWRYSAVINDLVVEKIFIEGGGVVQNSGPDPFEVSDAKTMLEYLRSKK